ncbi:hypothetical protein HU200_015588 [Digitaria exilis]|uniref:F-box domain-containing protein n=1 Tax=Digitaria exilis TaxID=1010633 RepID=A0A835F8D3_9POAL|nr:hypothetical protein HU200_015588 [Digitaria exilis]
MEMCAEAKKRRQAPAPPEGGEGSSRGVDRICGLCNAILRDIISLIPIKDGARTKILARRWRHLWRSCPLNLDCQGFHTTKTDFIGNLTRILSAHWDPGRRFRVPTHLIHRVPTPWTPGAIPWPSTTSRRLTSTTQVSN